MKGENTCPIIDHVTSKNSPVLLDFVRGTITSQILSLVGGREGYPGNILSAIFEV